VLPFFENFYAGGPRTVRGYEENTLGPKDTLGRALGGNFLMVGNAEVILPVPFFADVDSIRISGFFDMGNVYGLDMCYADNPTCRNEGFDIADLRYSTGLSGIWLSPFGMLSVSVAAPINDQSGDRTQPFQFTFGTSF